MTAPGGAFQATRGALFPGLTAAYRGMLVVALGIVLASFLVRATPRVSAPALLTFRADGPPVLELLEALPEPAASTDAIFVASAGDPLARCSWAVTWPRDATAPRAPIALSGARPTGPCPSPRAGAVHGVLLAPGRALALSGLLLPSLATPR